MLTRNMHSSTKEVSRLQAHKMIAMLDRLRRGYGMNIADTYPRAGINTDRILSARSLGTYHSTKH
jgi:hypothetical protein